MLSSPFAILLDISIKPDFNGLPPNLVHGLQQLTDNAAALLLLISGLGIVVSVAGIVIGSWLHQPQLTERARSGLFVSAGSGALLYVGVMAANYATRLFS